MSICEIEVWNECWSVKIWTLGGRKLSETCVIEVD